MPVMDEFREEREALKNSSFQKKLRYFWDYYKWYVIGGIVAIVAIVSFAKEIMANKELIFCGFVLNAYADSTAEQQFVNEFAQQAGLDIETYDALIDSSLRFDLSSYDQYNMVTINRIMVSLTAGDLDFIAADPEAFEHYAASNSYCDLTTLLSEEQLERYADKLYYIDMAEVERKLNAEDPTEYVAKEYDHTNPSVMEKPVLVGLFIQDAPKISSLYTTNQEEIILGIPVSSKHIDTSLQFIDYIFE